MAEFKIVKGSIDLGKDGRFAPGREKALAEALRSRKDAKSIVARLTERGVIVGDPVLKKSSGKKSEKKTAKGTSDESSDKTEKSKTDKDK